MNDSIVYGNTARIMELIVTTLTRRGGGQTPDDPVRIVTQFWNKNGELLAESDPFATPPAMQPATLTPVGEEIAALRDSLAEANKALAEALKEKETFSARVWELRHAIEWALGQRGEFPSKPVGAGAFWWRKELRKRAKLF